MTMGPIPLPRSSIVARRTASTRRSFVRVTSSSGNGTPEARHSQQRITVRCDGYSPNTFPVQRRLTQSASPDASSVRAFQSLVEERVAALVLGGGRGENLFPLTKSRAEAAVSLGGAYRMVDIPISNCINSGLKRIYVLTQYNSTSLNRHIARTYNQNPGLGSSVLVEVLAAARTPTENNWFRGTADAVRRYDWILKDIRSRNVEHVIILSGDHLYRMDYLAFLEEHMSKDADFTIACTPCSRQAAADYGLMKIRDGKVIQFAEKPTGVALEAMRTSSLGTDFPRPKQLVHFPLCFSATYTNHRKNVEVGEYCHRISFELAVDIGDDYSEEKPFLASMGVYVFKKDILLDLLDKSRNFDDFGREVIPFAYQNGYSVHANLFRGYWEDIGNMRSFYEANLGFNRHPQKFEFFLPGWPVYTCPHRGPPTTMSNCKIKNATISDGCWLQGCKIENSVIGLGSFVGARSIITDSVLMGASKVESEERRKIKREKGEIPLGVGQDCVVRNTIIDKDARIGDGCKLVNAGKVEEGSRSEIGCYIRDGLIVVEKGAEVPDWTII